MSIIIILFLLHGISILYYKILTFNLLRFIYMYILMILGFFFIQYHIYANFYDLIGDFFEYLYSISYNLLIYGDLLSVYALTKKKI